MSGLCDSLVEEHEIIERVLDALEKEAGKVSAGTPVDRAFFTSAISFVRQFADGVHHQKEEQVLFPALCNLGMPKDGGPVGVMLHEHDEGRGHIRAMDAVLPAASDGDIAAREQLVHEALAYVELLRAHIQKENMILFPMAARILDATRQNVIQQQFVEAERQDYEQVTLHRSWAAALSV